ncbi:DUF3179 domain-containing protein (plasmid) [Haloferax larsenii]|uniref:DUF3179 domain-containing protein n=1 Tax=Haloferax larsenii TaxID=302484 RepID=A0ABY5RIM9_HALLR|nr:DUF3179 domain-containing protein [Haloferax larsenii]UVE52014.1 DUF3179 domain-containing protein [Haloferax larsenii]
MDVLDVLPRDAIPSIDSPTFDTDYFGDGDDAVVVVEGNPSRAYPIRILSYHEIVNDVVDGTPIAVTWCPICGSAVVFERNVEGRTLTFGTSGKLADDALVMYDRETKSEWKQPLGRSISGAFEGTELTALPAPLLSWSKFQSEYPDGLVLQPVYGGEHDPRGQSPQVAYDMSPYDRYERATDFGLREMRGEGPKRTWYRDDIDAKTIVLGVTFDGEAVGYPLSIVEAEGGVVTDTVGGVDILVVSSTHGVTAFENPGFDFELRDETLHADHSSWDPMTGQSDNGRQLLRLPARRMYAFAWQDDHGRDSFYGL